MRGNDTRHVPHSAEVKLGSSYWSPCHWGKAAWHRGKRPKFKFCSCHIWRAAWPWEKQPRWNSGFLISETESLGELDSWCDAVPGWGVAPTGPCYMVANVFNNYYQTPCLIRWGLFCLQRLILLVNGLPCEEVPLLTIWAPAPPEPPPTSLLRSTLNWLEGNTTEG